MSRKIQIYYYSKKQQTARKALKFLGVKLIHANPLDG